MRYTNQVFAAVRYRPRQHLFIQYAGTPEELATTRTSIRPLFRRDRHGRSVQWTDNGPLKRKRAVNGSRFYRILQASKKV